MHVTILDPVRETTIFTIIFLLVLILSIGRKKDTGFFSLSTTNELKGLAVLAVVFSHIGYFLASDNRFLFPLSVFAGGGVDLFLLLSGYGLAMSACKKPLTPLQFYKKRINKIYLPLWITLMVFLLLDHFLLHLHYPWQTIGESFLGIFRRADLYLDINSPLWYVTLIMFYYLTFPWLFQKKYPLSSAIGIFLLTFGMTKLSLPVSDGVHWLYVLHIMAFPIGLASASLVHDIPRNIPAMAKIKPWAEARPAFVLEIRVLLAFLLALLVGYFAIHSGVGQDHWIEERISILTGLLIMATAIVKPFEIRALKIIGLFSYEIYLLHWPIMYRFDFLFRWLPASIALVAYLVVFLGLGWLLQKISAYTLGTGAVVVPKITRAKH